MNIDWFTLIAQLINFAVFVWLLRFLLYDRIIQAMNEREATIAGRLTDAANERLAAVEEKEAYRLKLHEFDKHHEAKLAEAKQQAEDYRQQLMKNAETKAEQAQAQWLESLQLERREMLQDFREKLSQQIISVTRHAFQQLADEDLESSVLRTFLKRLESIDKEERLAMIQAAQQAGGAVEVRTSFPVSAEHQKLLVSTLKQVLKEDLEIHFTNDPDLICGVELRVQSHHLIWSLESYLTDLESNVFHALEEKAIEYGKS